jgi:DNA-binding IclR family transcriptional regulator
MAQDLVKSAARTFEVLEVFASQRASLTATQIGTLLGYPKSSLNVLLRSMVSQGYLMLEGGGSAYFPTLRVTGLGDWIPAALFGSDALLPVLTALRDSTGETVTLTMASGREMRLLKAVQGTHPIALQLDEGTTFPLSGTAVGTAYLSTLDERSAAALLRPEGDDETTDETGATGTKVAAVARARAVGYAAAYETVVPDTGAIAMPISPPDSKVPLVIAVAGLAPRIKNAQTRIVAEMKKAIAALASPA